MDYSTVIDSYILKQLEQRAAQEGYSVNELLTIFLDILKTSDSLSGMHEKLRELQHVKARLQLQDEVVRIAWWEMEIESGKVRADPRKALMAGYDPKDFVDITYHAFTDLVHPEDYEPMMQAMRDLYEGRAKKYATDYRLRRADGGWIWFHDRGQMGQMKDGTRIVYGFVLDIDERKHAEQKELEIRLEQERLELLRKFVQNAMHEFRTPLATINLNSYLLTQIKDAEKRLAQVNTIQRQVKQVTALVDMLLRIVELDSVSHQFEPVNIREIIQESCDAVRMHYPDRPVEIDLSADVLRVEGHADFLREAIDALLDNARRFSPPESRIAVRMSIDESRQQVIITVEDEGAGIAEEDQPYIFETFWRKDSAHTTPGMGLGLPLVKRVVNVHGGTIDVQSEVGKGTTFTVRLPVLSGTM